MKGFCIAVLLACLAAGGCEGEKERPAATGQGANASASYRQHFGEPPAVTEGTCFALVGFYPSTAERGKVTPFPLFLFDDARQLEVVTEQLLHWGEGWDMGGVLSNPFPPGTELVSLRREGDLLRVELSAGALDETLPDERRAILNVLGHTLTQFEGVERVMVVAGGRLFPYQAERGFLPDPGAVAPPGPPRLLTVVGGWGSGKDAPEEVSAYFDRPVTVEAFDLRHAGKPVEGETFRSLFDMAVVVHPAEPSSLAEGIPLHVSWRVVDARGRRGAGEGDYPLKRPGKP